jgi:hypothetical protein
MERKNIIKCLLTYFMVLITVWCTGQVNPNFKHEIDLEKALRDNKKISLTSITDSVKYIKLETNAKCLVGRINKIIIHNNFIYVGSFHNIFKFDMNGKFICQIGTKGQGPREYVQLRDFVVKNDSLFILTRNKVLTFNINGSFLTEVSFNTDGLSLNKTNSCFITDNDQTGTIDFFDKKGNMVKSEKVKSNLDKKFPVMVMYRHQNLFFQNRDNFCVNTFHNDTIYQIDKSNIFSPYLLINLGKYKLPPNKRAEAVNLEKFGTISAPYVRPGLMETKNYIFLEINKWERKSQVNEFGLASNKVGSLGIILHEKSSSNSMIISSDGIDDDMPCFYPYFSDGQKQLISYVDAHEAVDYYQKNKSNPKLNRKFNEAVRNLKIDDNPIVMVAFIR